MNTFAKTMLAATVTATLALGVAAPASAQSWNGYDRDYRGWHDNDRGWGDGYRRGGDGERFAVSQCSRAAAGQLMRPGGNARVTGINDVDWTRGGFRVRGEIAVYDYNGGYGRASYQRGGFTCRVDRGRVVDIDYQGLRGWRGQRGW